MPIYEYVCSNCRKCSDILLMKEKDISRIVCRYCGDTRLERVLSRFALHATEAQRIADFNPRRPQSSSFYRDDRNVGLWAKKRLSQLGVDLGSGFEETVENARAGKLPEGELI